MHDESLLQVVRTAKIILVAMCLGMLLFAVIAVTMQPMKPMDSGWPLMVLIGLGFAAAMLALRTVLPSLLVKGQLEQLARQPPEDDAAALKAAYLKSTIVSGALLEGAGFVNLAAYWLERHPVSLAAAAVLIVVMLARLPSLHTVADWITDRQSELRQLRASRLE